MKSFSRAMLIAIYRWRSLHTRRLDGVPDGTSSLMMKLRWYAKCLLWEVYCNGSLAVTARHEPAQSAAAAGSNTTLLCFNLSALNTASDPSTFPSI